MACIARLKANVCDVFLQIKEENYENKERRAREWGRDAEHKYYGSNIAIYSANNWPIDLYMKWNEKCHQEKAEKQNRSNKANANANAKANEQEKHQNYAVFLIHLFFLNYFFVVFHWFSFSPSPSVLSVCLYFTSFSIICWRFVCCVFNVYVLKPDLLQKQTNKQSKSKSKRKRKKEKSRLIFFFFLLLLFILTRDDRLQLPTFSRTTLICK